MTPRTPDPDVRRPDVRRPDRRRWVVALAAVAAVGVLAVLLVQRLSDDDPAGAGEPAVAVAAREADVRASCDDWMGSPSNGMQRDDTWCDDMFAWMDHSPGSSTNGSTSGSTGGSTRWRGPEQMGAACREWIAEERFGSVGGDLRCEEMLGWMDDHLAQEGGRWTRGGDGDVESGHSRPPHDHRRQVGERVAEGGHLPVEHRDDRPVRRVDDDVVEAVVAVDDRVPLRRGHGGAEPLRQGVEVGEVAAVGGRQLSLPGAELPVEVARGTAQVAEADLVRHDRVQAHQHVDEVLRRRPRDRLAQSGELIGGA